MFFAMTVLFYMKKREIRCVQGKIIIKFLNNKVCNVDLQSWLKIRGDVAQPEDIKCVSKANFFL